jgi:radical SAM superfamily enzyme YgiQ (UPF0313 family)
MGREKATDPRHLLSAEEGTVFKDWGGRLPVALVYPNSYYLGMSNLGIHAIYRLLNGYGDVVCERAFWESGPSQVPFGLESGRPLSHYALIAFSITYELDYLNVPPILRAGGIPLYAAERNESQPLIIAGGACVMANPMPVAPFFDCLCIGEAEAILPRMLPIIADGIGGSRRELLEALSKLPGVYVPQHSQAPVARQWLADLDSFPVASAVLTPHTELGNLYLVEVERGCDWACRFCLVSSAFSPARYRSLDGLLAQAERGRHRRKRLGLIGPAVTDHPRIGELVEGLRRMGAELSVSSLRIKPLPEAVLAAVALSSRTLALAPEAGSEQLRRAIAKGFTEADILEAVARVAAHGVRQLKLYYMIGLPSETDEDAQEVVRLTLRCREVMEKERPGGRITLTVPPFIPKAGTPFQWLGMERLPVLEHRLAAIRGGLQPRGVRVRAESLAWGQVQAVLARGDERLAGVLAGLEGPSLSGWRRAMKESHLDTDHYAHQSWQPNGALPWAPISAGADTGHLRRELERVLALTLPPQAR